MILLIIYDIVIIIIIIIIIIKIMIIIKMQHLYNATIRPCCDLRSALHRLNDDTG